MSPLGTVWPQISSWDSPTLRSSAQLFLHLLPPLHRLTHFLLPAEVSSAQHWVWEEPSVCVSWEASSGGTSNCRLVMPFVRPAEAGKLIHAIGSQGMGYPPRGRLWPRRGPKKTSRNLVSYRQQWNYIHLQLNIFQIKVTTTQNSSLPEYFTVLSAHEIYLRLSHLCGGNTM